jgi:molybdopterin molybdotransferase
VRRVGGITAPPPDATVSARLDRDVPSAAGRLDVVQARVHDGTATPLFGASALLGPMVRADGWFRIPEAATGVGAGAEVEVTLYG